MFGASRFLRLAQPAQALVRQNHTFPLGEFKLHKLESGPNTTITVGKKDLMDYHFKMSVIRRFETVAGEAYQQKAPSIRGFLHLYSGQEAVCVGIRSEMKEQDTVVNAYRCHGWAYVMGVSVEGVLAELLGRFNGCSNGKGGSMHMYTPTFLGGNGIVGAQVPIAAGVAFAHKYKKDGGVCVGLYGDGAANQGQVFEAFNMAKLYNVPCIFVCENNKYAMGTHDFRGAANTEYFKRGDYIPGIRANGQDILSVKEAFRYAREYVQTKGPILLEYETYRYHGHSMSDPDNTYRTKQDIQEVRKTRDPIDLLGKMLIDGGIATEDELKDQTIAARNLVKKEYEKALAGSFPPLDQVAKHIFVEETKNVRGCDHLTKF